MIISPVKAREGCMYILCAFYERKVTNDRYVSTDIIGPEYFMMLLCMIADLALGQRRREAATRAGKASHSTALCAIRGKRKGGGKLYVRSSFSGYLRRQHSKPKYLSVGIPSKDIVTESKLKWAFLHFPGIFFIL